METFIGIVFLILSVLCLIGGITWMVDGYKVLKETYMPPKGEVMYSYTVLGLWVATTSLYMIVKIIIGMVG